MGFRGQRGRQGEQGPKGDPGPEGPRGLPGPPTPDSTWGVTKIVLAILFGAVCGGVVWFGTQGKVPLAAVLAAAAVAGTLAVVKAIGRGLTRDAFEAGALLVLALFVASSAAGDAARKEVTEPGRVRAEEDGRRSLTKRIKDLEDLDVAKLKAEIAALKKQLP